MDAIGRNSFHTDYELNIIISFFVLVGFYV